MSWPKRLIIDSEALSKGGDLMEFGKYRHFKGREYELTGIARHSETEEQYAVYRQLYGEYGLWIRPLAMFNEYVEHDGKLVKRFEKIAD